MVRHPHKRRCRAQTLSGKQCRNWARRESDPPRCRRHDLNALHDDNRRRCAQRTRTGRSCRNWAVAGRDICAFHARPRRAARRCTARLKRDRRCRNVALPGDGPRLCSLHAGVYTPHARAPASGKRRRCQALTASGSPCRKWALREPLTGAGPSLCYVHSPHHLAHDGPHPPRATGNHRCRALTMRGKRCRNWAKRPQPGKPAPPGALCSVHAARARVSPPQERRCSARNNAGQQCANWAVWGTTAQLGAPLCPAHLPHGDPRRVSTHLPQEDDQRRCRATTLDGRRCPLWAMVSAESDGLCWIHAFPHHHPKIKHSYYRRVPHFSKAEHALIRRLAREGPLLSAELLLVRLKLRDVLVYLGRTDIAHDDKDRAAYAIFGGAIAVANILLTRQKLKQINWGPRAAGNSVQLLDQILRHTPHPPPGDEPNPP